MKTHPYPQCTQILTAHNSYTVKNKSLINTIGEIKKMTCCTDVHKEFDKFANGPVQVGKLPEWMHVNGKVAWYVYQGPYSELGPKGFTDFWKKFGDAKLKMDGAPGDVYVCSPECHEKDKQAKMLTILWCPIK